MLPAILCLAALFCLLAGAFAHHHIANSDYIENLDPSLRDGGGIEDAYTFDQSPVISSNGHHTNAPLEITQAESFSHRSSEGTQGASFQLPASSNTPTQAGALNLILAISAIGNFLARFVRRMAGYNEHVINAMLIVQIIHDALKSEGAKTITDLIPGDWDDKFRKSMLGSLATVIRSYGVVNEATEKLKDSDLFDKFLEWLDDQPKVVQKAIYHKTASTLLVNREGMKENEADLLVQAQYTVAKAQA